MMAPWKPYRTAPHIAIPPGWSGGRVPDEPESPPAVDEDDYDRIQRNGCRYDAIAALGTVISRLDELDHDGEERWTQLALEMLRNSLENDLED